VRTSRQVNRTAGNPAAIAIAMSPFSARNFSPFDRRYIKNVHEFEAASAIVNLLHVLQPNRQFASGAIPKL
jgi:hypothetical protein